MNYESGWDIPKRYLDITLYDGRASDDLQPNKVLDAFSIRNRCAFNTSSSVSGSSSEANITLYGLKPETIYFLTTAPTVWTTRAIQNRITIDAGYEDNHAVIFDGNITDGSPLMDTADFGVQLKAVQAYSDGLADPIALSYPGDVPIARIAAGLAKAAGFALFDEVRDAGIISTDYQYSGSLKDHLDNISAISGLYAYIHGSRLYLTRRGQSSGGGEMCIDYHTLVSSPVLDTQGGTFRIKMNPQPRSGQALKCSSLRFPELKDGAFTIQTISNSGDTYGSNWFTEIKATRENLGGWVK
jgi:hypothetical protein